MNYASKLEIGLQSKDHELVFIEPWESIPETEIIICFYPDPYVSKVIYRGYPSLVEVIGVENVGAE